MINPPLNFTIRDNDNNIDYVVYAHRNLTRAELFQAVRIFRSTPEGKRVTKNTKYKIITTIGAD